MNIALKWSRWRLTIGHIEVLDQRLSGVHPASFNPGDNDDDDAFRPRRRSNTRQTTTDTLNQTRSSETNSSPDSSLDTVDSVDDKKDPPWSPTPGDQDRPQNARSS
jgi:hypothetical protein